MPLCSGTVGQPIGCGCPGVLWYDRDYDGGCPTGCWARVCTLECSTLASADYCTLLGRCTGVNTSVERGNLLQRFPQGYGSVGCVRGCRAAILRGVLGCLLFETIMGLTCCNNYLVPTICKHPIYLAVLGVRAIKLKRWMCATLPGTITTI